MRFEQASTPSVVPTAAPMPGRLIGEITDYAGITIPPGWLVCQGQAVSRATYYQLFLALGTTWGVGDGSTTFNIPNLIGRMKIGAGTSSGAGSSGWTYGLGSYGGEEGHVLSEAELAQHNHGGQTSTAPNTGTESVWHQHNQNWNIVVSAGSSVGAVAGGGWQVTGVSNAIGNQNALHVHGTGAAGIAIDGSSYAHNNQSLYAVVNTIIYAGA